MEFKEYYKTLGVEQTASEAEIKKAYRTLARKYHPDVSKEADASARMAEVNEAYAVLSDPEKRAAFDKLAQRRAAGQDFQPPPGWDAGFDFSDAGSPVGDDGDFSEFFNTLFGRAARARRGGGAQRANARWRSSRQDLDRLGRCLPRYDTPAGTERGAPRRIRQCRYRRTRARRADTEGRQGRSEHSPAWSRQPRAERRARLAICIWKSSSNPTHVIASKVATSRRQS